MTTDVIVLVQNEQVVVNTQDKVTVITQLAEGPQGPPGPPGPPGDASGALLISNALSELATDPDTQARAQANIGLGSVDPLAYYILAKS